MNTLEELIGIAIDNVTLSIDLKAAIICPVNEVPKPFE